MMCLWSASVFTTVCRAQDPGQVTSGARSASEAGTGIAERKRLQASVFPAQVPHGSVRKTVPYAPPVSGQGVVCPGISPESPLQVWGNVIYARTWEPEDAVPRYGMCSYDLSPAGNYLYADRLVADADMRANGSGVIYNGILHTMLYDVDMYYQEWNVADWTRIRRVKVLSKDLLATDTDYDVVTGLSYGCYFDPSTQGHVFAAVDYASNSKLPLRPCDLYIAVAVNSKGEVYAVKYADNGLYRIDKATGEETFVGNTGIDVGDYLQSATFDRSTDVMYWACNDAQGESFLCMVDTATGRATRISTFADKEQLSCLYIPTRPDGDVPAKATGASVAFADGSLDGTVKFTMPSVTNSGKRLEGNLGYQIMVNGDVREEGTALPGETVGKNIGVKGGFSQIRIFVGNEAGRSESVNILQWFGADCPRPVGKARLAIDTGNRNEAVVSWVPDNRGVHGGYVDVSALRYDVVRYPDSAVVASGIAETTWKESLGDAAPGGYRYGIVARNGSFRSDESKTNMALAKGIFPVPYLETFDSREAFSMFVVSDVNNDFFTWDYNGKAKMASCLGSSAVDGDDWLLTPEIKLRKGLKYKLAFVYKGFGETNPEKLEVKVGQGTDAASYREVVAPMEIRNYDRESMEQLFEITEDGNYRIGFHAISKAGARMVYVDSIAVTEYAVSEAPALVGDLKVVPADKGELSAEISFVAPVKTAGGGTLTSIDRIELKRDGNVMVQVFEKPLPGTRLQAADKGMTHGEHQYAVVACNDKGKGEVASVSVYVGQDIPQAPAALTLAEKEDHFTLSWQQAGEKGVSGKFVDADKLTYNIYTTDLKGFLYPYRTGLTGTSLDIKDDYAYGKQQFMTFIIKAQSPAGESEPTYSNSMIGGKSYGLPFVESFRNGETPDIFLLSQGHNPFRLADNISFNDDSGCIGWKSNGFDNEGFLGTGKISCRDSGHPCLVYAYYALPGSTMKLTTSVSLRNGKTETADVLDFSRVEGQEGWRLRVVDLEAYRDEAYLLLQFHAECSDIYTPLYIDHLRIEDFRKDNLRISSIVTPPKAHTGHPAPVTVRVENAGMNAAKAYRLQLFVDGNAVQTLEAADLEAFGGINHRFDFVPQMSEKDSFEVHALVDYPKDMTEADNKSESRKVAFFVPDYPRVNDLQACMKDGKTVLKWTEPRQESIKINESFEQYLHKDNVFGDWMTCDLDRGQTYTNTQMDAGYSNVEASFWVFNPYVAAVTAENMPFYTPQDGRQCLIAVASQRSTIKNGDRNDDWLVSPEIGDSGQTISFYVKAAKEKYGKEPFEVHYSTTYPTPGCFKRILADSAGGSWKKVVADLPEGTRYFAIRYTGTDKNFIFMADRIEYETGLMKVRGYNVYRNGEKIGETTCDDPSFEVSNTSGSGNYHVTVVYSNGESGFSNAAGIIDGVETTDALAVPTDIYTIQGILVKSQATDTKGLMPGVYVMGNGRKIVVR